MSNVINVDFCRKRRETREVPTLPKFCVGQFAPAPCASACEGCREPIWPGEKCWAWIDSFSTAHVHCGKCWAAGKVIAP